MNAKVISVRAKDGKAPLVILYTDCDGKKSKYTISEGTYRDIGCPLSGEILDEDMLYIVAKEDERLRAIKKALNLLSYADNNEKKLYTKLVLAGFGKEASKNAVCECVRLGYVNEERQIERLIIRYWGELHGPDKIIYKLISKGYNGGLAYRIMQTLERNGEIDFDASKEKLIEKKLPCDASEADKRKLLYKFGFKK